MHLYFLFRKIVFSLMVLIGIGVIILLVRFYWWGPEEQPAANFPVQPPTRQGAGGTTPLLENKIDFLKEQDLATKTEPPSPEPAEESERRLSAALSATTETKSTVPPPTVEKKPPPPALKPEVRPAASSSTKEIKKEPPPKEVKKETKTKEPAQNNKPTPELKNSESKNDIQQPDKKTVAVKAGDSIYTIAEEHYKVSNTSIVDRIMESNPKIANPDVLTANQKIRLPEITEESLVIQSPDASVKIRLGTFMKPEFALFLKRLPALQGKEIEINPWKTPSGRTLYRATAGKFNSREEGLEVIRNLKEQGGSPYFEGFKKKN
jgi:hypothetical protein